MQLYFRVILLLIIQLLWSYYFYFYYLIDSIIYPDVCLGEGSSFLSFLKGDLLILEEGSTGETVQNSGWCVGTVERTDEKGDFPAETVYVLPCLTKPPADILVSVFYIKSFILFVSLCLETLSSFLFLTFSFKFNYILSSYFSFSPMLNKSVVTLKSFIYSSTDS